MGKKIRLLALLVLLAAGLGVLLYPTISSAVNQRSGSYAIQEWEQQLELLEDGDLELQRQQAERFNDALLAGAEPENYGDILDLGNGMMGYVRIPSIKVDLPIYHGVGEEALSKGVGHLPQSSFPIGREGDHAVLTGHTGLPSARLFTDLTKLREGDLFYVRVLEKELCYQVDQILVVLPSEGEDLMPVPGRDLCTLVTCTPYGINSHRLLVRGSRVELPTAAEEPVLPEPDSGGMSLLWLFALVPPVILGGIFLKRRLDAGKKPAYNGKYLRREG